MSDYVILPLNFKLIDNDALLLTNNCGEYYFIEIKDFDRLLRYSFDKKSEIFRDLKSKQFVADTNSLDVQLELLATKYRSRKSFLKNFTSLHMMVITYRCNHQCNYCQATSEVAESHRLDMTTETARKIVELIYCSPSPEIKIEFQGGEPLLNWNAVVEVIKYSEELNSKNGKKVEYVLCTNLTLLDEEKCEFLKDHDVLISTSLDGGKNIHDANRVLRVGESSYDIFIEKLRMTGQHIGFDKVGALMTTTKSNLNDLRSVVDEYVRLGFDCIFLRALNPYGLAAENYQKLGYSVEDFIEAFKDTLEYILALNSNGIRFAELYTTLLLSRILTPFSTGFVDLQSPSGAGISGVIYDYNGDVYPADEARMLARMGDKRFFMGNVFEDSYLKIFNGKIIRELVSKSCLEIMPECSTCVYQPFCGSDPVRNYLETGDIIGHRPSSDFCKKNKGIFDFLFSKLKDNDPEEMNIFWSWITNRSTEEIRCENIQR